MLRHGAAILAVLLSAAVTHRALADDDLSAFEAKLCGPRETQPEVAARAEREMAMRIGPARVFDNLYFLGEGFVSSWAVTTSGGIVLIDALNDPAEAKELIVGGLKRLGLNPADIKFVVVTHGHGDHYGGAQYLKDTYGAKILLGAADWETLAAMKAGSGPLPKGWRENIPDRDLTVTDGETLTVGDTSIAFYVTPGHTAGTLSMIIPVTDHGKPHVVAMFGGTTVPASATSRMQYRDSVTRFAGIAREARVDGLIANHPQFDFTLRKLPLVQARSPGSANPYIVGAEGYAKYLGVLSKCGGNAPAP
jgi:metallo-beta-lactamase class B